MLLFSKKAYYCMCQYSAYTWNIMHSLHDFFLAFTNASHRTICLDIKNFCKCNEDFFWWIEKNFSFGSQIAVEKLNGTAGFEWIQLKNSCITWKLEGILVCAITFHSSFKPIWNSICSGIQKRRGITMLWMSFYVTWISILYTWY